MAKPPARSTWVIEMSRADADGAPLKAGTPQMKLPSELRLEVDSDRNTRGTISYTDGSELVFYVFGGRVFNKASNSANILSFPVDPPRTTMKSPLWFDFSIYDLRKDRFPQIFWISEKTYAGIQKIGGTAYYHYETPSPQSQDALIDVNSLTPLSITSQGMTYKFERSEGPESIPVPPEFQAMIKQKTQEAKAAAAMLRSNVP